MLRQTQGAGLVAFMPAQLSAVSLHKCVAAGHVLCTQQLAVTAVMLLVSWSHLMCCVVCDTCYSSC